MGLGTPRRLRHLLFLLGWAAAALPAHAQFAQRVLAPGALQGWPVAPPNAASNGTSALPATGPVAVQPDAKLPSCPNSRILSTQGVPEDWSSMSMRKQVAHPINAMILQLAYAVWQDDPAAMLGKCLDNMGIDTDSIYVTHKAVLPYLGTMTSLVMRAGDKGVFVSFRGTNFEDPGDVLVDADCQHTAPMGKLFGSSSGRNIRLHTGFYRAWDTLGSYVLEAVKKQLALTSTSKVYVIGHSLGAAMATIAALRMDHLFADTDYEVGGVWLFGCPRVGNEAWAEAYNARLLDRTLRFANYADFASRLPTQSQFCTTLRLGGTFEFRHVGKALLLCPNASTGLVDWRLSPRGSEVLDCGSKRPDTPDLTVTTHWLGPYLDAWRRGWAAVLGEGLGDDPHVLAIMCNECSLSYPEDRAKQLNVPARAGGPVGCCSTASCGLQTAWDAAAAVGADYTRRFNPSSVCSGYVCT